MSCSSTAPNNYGASNWVAGHLPIRYNVSNTKWPVNSTDSSESITAFAASGSYTEVTLNNPLSVGANAALQYIKISGATIDGYDGVWQVDSQTASDTYVIRMPFLGSGTATGFQRYYNNYAVVALVYTGIRPGHYLAAERPIALRGTVKVVPDSSNNAEIAVESFVQADLSPLKNNLCDVLEAGEFVANDWNAWTSFYIAYAETYDESDGTEVYTFTSAFTTDSAGGGVINYMYASNSAKQFQDIAGGSMGEYALADYSVLKPAKWMTNFVRPTYFAPFEFDLSVINTYQELAAYESLLARVVEYSAAGAVLATTDLTFPDHDEGVYRVALSQHTFSGATSYFTVQIIRDTGSAEIEMSEVITVNYDIGSCRPDAAIYLRWLSPLGGWDSWLFKRNAAFGIRTGDSDLIRRDVTGDWDTNFVNGDTEDDYIYTDAFDTVTVNSQFTTDAETNVVNRWLRISNKVYQNRFADDTGCGNYKNITVLVDRSDFEVYRQGPTRNEISLTFRYTDKVRLQGQ